MRCERIDMRLSSSLAFVKVSLGRSAHTSMWLEKKRIIHAFQFEEAIFVTKYDPIVYCRVIQGEQFSTKIEKNNEPRGVSCDFAVLPV